MNYQTFRERFSSFICFSNEQVRVAFPGFSRSNYQEWLGHGYIVRLRRGWYAFADAMKKADIGDYFAGKIYSPSYLSCEYVLSRFGLIPESVVQFTSVTALKTASFTNAFGEFFYRSVKPELMFGYGVQMTEDGLPVAVASAEKALCDFLYLNPRYTTVDDMRELRLEEDTLSDVFAAGRIEGVAARFSSRTLRRKIDLLREAYGM